MEVFKSCGVETSDDVCIEMEDDVMVIVRGMIQYYVSMCRSKFQVSSQDPSTLLMYSISMQDWQTSFYLVGFLSGQRIANLMLTFQ